MLIVKEFGQSLKFLLSFGVTFVVLISGLILVLDWPQFEIFYINKLIAEALVFLALSWLLYFRYKPLRPFAFLPLLVLALIYYVQINSLEFSGAYLPSVALENAQHVDFLFDPSRVAWLIILLTAFVFTIYTTINWASKAPRFRGRALAALLLIVISVIVKNDKKWLSDENKDDRFQFYNTGMAGIEYKTPVSALSDTLNEYYQAMIRERWIQQASVELSTEAAEFAYDFGYSLNEKNPEYPLLKDLKFDTPLDFISQQNEEVLNVIVFFVEGMSSRIIQPYSQNFPEISPNIERLSKKSIVVDNYYSHSYATYRGLAGQFCSLFANQRLSDDVNYRCLPHLLAEKGYETHFMFSQSKKRTDLDDVGARAGYTFVHGSEELSQFIPDAEDKDEHIISDRSFVLAFKRWLAQREKITTDQDNGKPFFAALYNFQTHTGVHLKPGFKYQDPTGKSDSFVLDTFHNFDVAFKTFLDYFENSALAKNTVVVVTSDHATFATKEYARLVGHNKGYAPVFADQIPLIIYHPRTKPMRFDAGQATSLNLAPSLLNILGLEFESVPLLGRSVFDQETEFPKPLVAGVNVTRKLVRDGYWFRQQLGIDREIPKYSKQAAQHHEFVLYIQSLERENRLTPPLKE